jgi:hypothetical protein
MRETAGLCPAPAKEPFAKGSLESPKPLTQDRNINKEYSRKDDIHQWI